MNRRTSRSYDERRASIERTLRQKMSITLGTPTTLIESHTPLGDSYISILNQVAVAERGTPLKNFGPTNHRTTFAEAVGFLITAVQQ